MYRLWLLNASKLGFCAGLAFLGLNASKIHCSPLKSKSFFFSEDNIFRWEISSLARNFKRKYGLTCPHISLNVNEHKLRSASFNITADEKFSHLKFYNCILEICHQFDAPINIKVEDSTRSILGNTIVYKFQYFLIDYKGNKITTVIRLIGNTKTNIYKFMIEKDGKFYALEKELVLNALALVNKFGAKYNEDYKALSRISETGWEVTEPLDNDFDVKGAFGEAFTKVNMEKIASCQSEEGA